MFSRTLCYRALRMSCLPALLHRYAARWTLVVAYHGVIPDRQWRDWETADMIAESVFRKHLDFYRRHYHVVSLQQAVANLATGARHLPPNPLVITFDDGFKNNLQYAVPALREHGFPATFFVTSGFLDGSVDFWWLRLKRCVLRAFHNRRRFAVSGFGQWSMRSPEEAAEVFSHLRERLKALRDDERTRVLDQLHLDSSEEPDTQNDVYEHMTWCDAREMARQGMEIGAHTVTHVILSQEPADRARREILESVRRVRDEVHQRDVPFSYPNGQPADFTPAIVAMVREAGCYAAVAGFPCANVRQTDRYEMRRCAVAGYHTIEALELDLCGIRPALNRLRRMAKKALGGA